MDLYSKPHHLGTWTNGGRATRYALVGPSGGDVPEGYERFDLPAAEALDGRYVLPVVERID